MDDLIPPSSESEFNEILQDLNSYMMMEINNEQQNGNGDASSASAPKGEMSSSENSHKQQEETLVEGGVVVEMKEADGEVEDVNGQQETANGNNDEHQHVLPFCSLSFQEGNKDKEEDQDNLDKASGTVETETDKEQGNLQNTEDTTEQEPKGADNDSNVNVDVPPNPLEDEDNDEEPPPPGEEQQEGEEEQARIKLTVSNIPPEFSVESIQSLFEPFGTVLHCDINPEKNEAEVHLDSELGGYEAIKDLNKIKLCGKLLNVIKSRTGSEVSSEDDFSDIENVGTFKLYLSGLKMGITKDEVKKLVEDYGRVVDIEVYMKNSAFVHMELEEGGLRVISALNRKRIPEAEKLMSVSVSKNPEGPLIQHVKLQIKNFPEELTADQIRSLFQPYGLVLGCVLYKSKFDLLRKADVMIEQLGDIRSAINDLSELEMNGKKLTVEPLVEKVPKAEANNSIAEGGGRGKRGKGFQGPPSRRPPLLMPPSMRGRGRPPHSPFGPGRGMGMMRGMTMGPPPLLGGRGLYDGYEDQNPFGPERIPRDRQALEMELYQQSGGFHRPGPQARGGRGGGRGRGMGRGRGFGRGMDMRINPAAQMMDQEDYDYDQYYEDPQAAVARDHYSHLESQYELYSQQIQRGGNSRGRGRGRGGGGNFRSNPNAIPVPLMQSPVSDYNSFTEDDYSMDYDQSGGRVPFTHQHPTLNLSFGEREYFPSSKNSQQQKMRNMRQQHQQQQEVESFQKQQMMIASGLVPPPPSSQDMDFTSDDFSPVQTPMLRGGGGYPAYPSQHGQDQGFAAVPFDYASLNNKRRKQIPPTNAQNPLQIVPRTPGAKVYINHAGKVMVRGNRGGKKNPKKRAGLGSKQQVKTSKDSANLYPIGGFGGAAAGPSSSTSNNLPSAAIADSNAATSSNSSNNAGPSSINYSGTGYTFKQFNYKGSGGRGRGRGRGGGLQKKVKDDEEYQDWLRNKAWMHHAIPGIIRPAKK